MLNQLRNHPGVRRYVFNTSWLFAEKILRLVAGLFVGVWIARYLGPENFGMLSYSQSFVGLFSVIASFGLDGIVVRELVKNESKRDILLGTAFTLKLGGAIFVLMILAFAVWLMDNSKIENILVFFIASAVVFQSFNVIDLYFQSKVLSKYVVFVNISLLLLSSLLKIGLILAGASIEMFAAAVLFDGFFLASGLIYVYVRRKIRIWDWRFDRKLAIDLARDSWPLILSAIVISVYMKIDQVMIKEMLGAESVGYYAAAVRLSEVWYFIPMALVSSLFPAIVNAKNTNLELYRARLQRLYDFMFMLSVVIVLPMVFVGGWLVHFLYGNQFIEAEGVLVIHVWACIFVFMGAASGQWLLSENLQKYSALNTGLGAVINVLLNYVLIPVYGITGAAIATVVSYALAAYISLLFWDKTRINFFMVTRSFNVLRIVRGLR